MINNIFFEDAINKRKKANNENKELARISKLHLDIKGQLIEIKLLLKSLDEQMKFNDSSTLYIAMGVLACATCFTAFMSTFEEKGTYIHQEMRRERVGHGTLPWDFLTAQYREVPYQIEKPTVGPFQTSAEIFGVAILAVTMFVFYKKYAIEKTKIKVTKKYVELRNLILNLKEYDQNIIFSDFSTVSHCLDLTKAFLDSKNYNPRNLSSLQDKINTISSNLSHSDQNMRLLASAGPVV